MTISAIIVALAFALAFVVLRARWMMAARAEFIRSYAFPRGLFEKLRNKYPHLELKDCQLASQALRHYFLAHLKSGRQFVSMPSHAVDELWHEFILHTKDYARFCERAFGQFMHHTPAAVLSSNRQSNAGLRRCWWYVCREENINPRKATRLPLLFALDTKLNIPNGFRYQVDCRGLRERTDGGSGSGSSVTHCGGDFSSSSFDGTVDGFGDSSSFGFGDSSGDGAGDGGCGGGCGGGGD